MVRDFKFVNIGDYLGILFLLDIISLEQTNTTSRNVFTELRTLYTLNTHSKPESLFSKINSPAGNRTENFKEYTITFALLPHQVFIMPLTWLKALPIGALDEYQILDNETIR